MTNSQQGLAPGTAMSSMLLNKTQVMRLPFKSWNRGIIIQQRCHSVKERYHAKRDRFINVTSVCLTAITGSAIFGSVNNGGTSSNQIVTISAGVIALVSTLLQAVHKALEDGIQAEKHRLALKYYTKMRIRLESLIGNADNFECFKADDLDEMMLYSISSWVKDYHEKVEFIPNISPKLYDKEKKKYTRNELDKDNKCNKCNKVVEPKKPIGKQQQEEEVYCDPENQTN